MDSSVMSGGPQTYYGGPHYVPPHTNHRNSNLLVGRYRYEQSLGKGGFGVVHQYLDLLSGEQVAIKTILQRFVDQEPKRLVREIDILAHVYDAHQHVISFHNLFPLDPRSSPLSESHAPYGHVPGSLHDDMMAEMMDGTQASVSSKPSQASDIEGRLDLHHPMYQHMTSNAARAEAHQQVLLEMASTVRSTDNFHVCIVMPLMKGDLLAYRKYVQGSQFANPEFIAEVSMAFAFQICFGLDYLHKCNIVHRDLKPENILIRLDLESAFRSIAVIADFGLARDAQVTETYYVCTRHYRPPEVVTNTSKGTTAMDIWSLGCILYELCTFSTLFTVESARGQNGQWNGQKASSQLEQILNVVGTPSVKDVECYLEGNVRSYLTKTTPRPCTLEMRIRQNWHLKQTDLAQQDMWIDLIKSCLAFFPEQRPTAEELCRHRLFQSYNIQYGGNVLQVDAMPYQPIVPFENSERERNKGLALRTICDIMRRVRPLPEGMLLLEEGTHGSSGDVEAHEVMEEEGAGQQHLRAGGPETGPLADGDHEGSPSWMWAEDEDMGTAAARAAEPTTRATTTNPSSGAALPIPPSASESDSSSDRVIREGERAAQRMEEAVPYHQHRLLCDPAVQQPQGAVHPGTTFPLDLSFVRRRAIFDKYSRMPLATYEDMDEASRQVLSDLNCHANMIDPTAAEDLRWLLSYFTNAKQLL